MDLEVIKEITSNVDLSEQLKSFAKAVETVVLNGAEYVVKALPIQENVRDVLTDVAEVLKTKDFSTIVDTAVVSSVREGMEYLGVTEIFSMSATELVELAKKGGLRESLTSSIEVVFDKFTSNNLLGDTITSFVEDIKTFITSKEFDTKLEKAATFLQEKKDQVVSLFESWKEAYENFDLNEVTEIFNSMSKTKSTINANVDLKYEYSIIKNIMEFVSEKQDKLSVNQLEFCKSV